MSDTKPTPVVFTKADEEELRRTQLRVNELQRAQEEWQARFRHPLTALVNKTWPFRADPNHQAKNLNTLADWVIANKDEITRIYALMEPINVRKNSNVMPCGGIPERGEL